MSETKHLPAVVRNVIPRLQQAALAGDKEAMSDIIQWGYAGIDQEYEPDPIFRPLDYLRKSRAEREWRQIIRATGQQLRTVMTQKQVEAFQYELDRRIDERKFQDVERRRRESLGWDKTQRIDEYKETRGFDTDEQIRLAQAMAQINRQTIDAAPPQLDPMERVRQLQQEIARIQGDPALTNAMKHRQTEPLQQSIRDILGSVGRGK